MTNGKQFGKRVEKMRLERGLSTEELATKAGLSYQSVWRIERGLQGTPGLFTAGRLAQALRCSLDYLIALNEEDIDSEYMPAAVA